MKVRHIAIATGTRADWGLLSGIARELEGRADCRVSVIATNMHLDPRYGNTIDEIRADGFEPAVKVEMTPASDSETDTAIAAGRCLEGMARALARLQPDLLVILGDRYEMLATATAAAIMRVPIAHIAGGEISQGAIDDNIRHAITKLSSLHLTATEPYRQRVLELGEDPGLVINTGAIGVYNALNLKLMSAQELSDSVGFAIDRSTLLVTLHPATADASTTAGDAFRRLAEALDRFPHMKVLVTYPNNDANGLQIIEAINHYADARPERVKVVPSLGKVRYLSALQHVAAVVGNSSSGIVEVPSAGIPTVDIGPRQRGRIAGKSVIHADDTVESIAEAIQMALSPRMQALAALRRNPYHRPDTLRLIVEAIATTPLEALRAKRFHDVLPIDNR